MFWLLTGALSVVQAQSAEKCAAQLKLARAAAAEAKAAADAANAAAQEAAQAARDADGSADLAACATAQALAVAAAEKASQSGAAGDSNSFAMLLQVCWQHLHVHPRCNEPNDNQKV